MQTKPELKDLSSKSVRNRRKKFHLDDGVADLKHVVGRVQVAEHGEW